MGSDKDYSFIKFVRNVTRLEPELKNLFFFLMNILAQNVLIGLTVC